MRVMMKVLLAAAMLIVLASMPVAALHRRSDMRRLRLERDARKDETLATPNSERYIDARRDVRSS